jgi:murein DD-endopeptidase MepM/ murein hydrolase activator NlpD
MIYLAYLKPRCSAGFMKVHIKVARSIKKRSTRFPLLVFIFLSFSVYIVLSFIPKERPPAKETSAAVLEESSPSPPPLEENKMTIQKGMTLSDILSSYGFSPAEIHQLREDVKPVYDLAKIKAGQEMRIYTSQDGAVVSVEYDIDDESYLLIRRGEVGFTAEIKTFPVEFKTSMICGIIEENLPSAVVQENEKEAIAYELAEIFAWDIDFYTDLRKGDSFKIVFEKKYLEDEWVGYGRILAAEFTNQGEMFKAFRYTYPDTEEWDYFTPDGHSLRKEFLKSPIKYARITSRFSFSRYHPTRKVYRPHYGVDYAARVGTPVQATADGTVTFVGWNGASGRMVRIRHQNAYESMYLHLRGYARGIKKGAKVTSGQVIGYVGSSGESSGPHLDYRIKFRGRYINPLAHRFKPVKPLRPEFSEDFKKHVGEFSLCLNAPLTVFASVISIL